MALDLATQEELDTIAKYAFKVNEVLKKIMLDANIRLIDFKLEFGRLSDGTIILADEISRIPAASGMPPPVPTWIKTCSAAALAVRPMPTRKL